MASRVDSFGGPGGPDPVLTGTLLAPCPLSRPAHALPMEGGRCVHDGRDGNHSALSLSLSALARARAHSRALSLSPSLSLSLSRFLSLSLSLSLSPEIPCPAPRTVKFRLVTLGWARLGNPSGPASGTVPSM